MLPKGTTEIGSYSFSENSNVTSFHLTNGVKTITAAIALRYRLFRLACYENKDIHSNFSLAEDYKLLKEKQFLVENRIEELGKIEQTRWALHMYTRGWERPTTEQLNHYLYMPGNTGHKYLLGLFHPYLTTDWDDLDDGEQVRIVNQFYKKTFDDRTTPAKDITKDGVLKAIEALEKVFVKEMEQEQVER